MDSLPHSLPLLVLDESSRRRLGHLPDPLSPYFLRHRRLIEDKSPGTGEEQSKPDFSTATSIKTLSEGLPAGDRIGVVWSPSRVDFLVRSLLTSLSSVHRLHMVLSNRAFEQMAAPLKASLIERAISVVLVSNTRSEQDQLTGCLQALTLVLGSKHWAFLKGLLAWQGSPLYRDIPESLDPDLVAALGSKGKRLVIARVTEGHHPWLHGLVEAHCLRDRLVTGPRPVGMSIGVLMRRNSRRQA